MMSAGSMYFAWPEWGQAGSDPARDFSLHISILWTAVINVGVRDNIRSKISRIVSVLHPCPMSFCAA